MEWKGGAKRNWRRPRAQWKDKVAKAQTKKEIAGTKELKAREQCLRIFLYTKKI